MSFSWHLIIILIDTFLKQWVIKRAIFSLLPKHISYSNFHWSNVLSQPIRISFHITTVILESEPVKLSIFLKISLVYQFLYGFLPHSLQIFLNKFICFYKSHWTKPNSGNMHTQKWKKSHHLPQKLPVILKPINFIFSSKIYT